MKKLFAVWFSAMVGALLATIVASFRHITMDKTLSKIVADFAQEFNLHGPAFFILIAILVVVMVVIFVGRRPPEE